MPLQVNEEQFNEWIQVITPYFDTILGEQKIKNAARGCIAVFGETLWYELKELTQVDCIDCYIKGWVDSRKSIREDFR